jgi:hypothetical protein
VTDDDHLYRRGVHRDEHVGLVARRIDRRRAKVDLEGRDPERGALRCTDFGGEVREGRKVVAGQRRRKRELPAGQLHSVAAVSGEADDDRFRFARRGGFVFGDQMFGGGHASPRVLPPR